MELEDSSKEPQHVHPRPNHQNSILASVTEPESKTETISRPKQDRVVHHVEYDIDTDADADTDTMAAWSNLTTVAMKEQLYSGFRNQMMAFMFFVFQAQMGGPHGSQIYGQLLLDTISMKEFGAWNKQIRIIDTCFLEETFFLF